MRSAFRWAACLVLGAVGCGDCRPDPPLRPDKCFASTFDYYANPYPYELPGGMYTECEDPEFERNEDMTQAAAPTSHECTGERTAHIDGDEDVDVFRTGECKGSIYTNLPTELSVTANVTQADANLRFCIFPLCEAGPTNLQSCSGERSERFDEAVGSNVKIVWDTRLASGFVGCCRVGPGTLEAAFFCPMYSRKVDTYFWVDAGELPLESECSKYTFTYDVNVD